MSRAPSRAPSMAAAPRASQPGLAPPGAQFPMRGSSIFAPPNPIPSPRLEPPPLSATLGPMPGTAQRPLPGPRKRLIVACDGTWLNSDHGIQDGRLVPPSNVSRISWAMKETSRDGIPQVIHYVAGVGSQGGPISRALSGALALGLRDNVRQAYSYVAINYKEGDEIFLIGFSRGAFTARCVGGMIGDFGLLTRQGLPFFPEIFQDYIHRHDARYVSKFPDLPFPGASVFDGKYVRELEQRGMTRMRIPIRAIAVWDTVGALGVPRIPLFENIGLQSRRMKDMRFWDTLLYEGIENAFQALALDEHRAPFGPAVWEKPRNSRTNLKQVWFPGVHSNVGGGYDDQELANITLAWMISRLEPFIDFRPDFIQSVYDSNRQYYKSTEGKTRQWSCGKIIESMTGKYLMSGSKTRTPGNYYRMDPVTGQPTSKHLRNTNEYIHASVRCRIGLPGPGIMDRGDYQPKALADWGFAVEERSTEAKEPTIIWTNKSPDFEGQREIPEAVLLDTERRLLANSAKAEAIVLDMTPPKKRTRQRRSRPPEADGKRRRN